MSDNGFLFGEHGLIDKRCAYEESMRIPMVARCPALFGGGRDGRAGRRQPRHRADHAGGRRAGAAGVDGGPQPAAADARRGRCRGGDELLYEYYWERNFPQTPTVHALREDRYKYVRYHGVWDIDELYDLAEDPAREPQPDLLARAMRGSSSG